MGDDADRPAALVEAHQGADREVEGLVVERAEALVDEHRLEADAAGVRLDDLCQSRGERERRHGRA
ncbi:MAG TPA: hypothetical protein VIK38_03455 [Coriobacteriia bacterium]